MTRVPFAAAFVGAAGLIPFVYGLMLLFAAPDTLPHFGLLAPGPQGGTMLMAYFGAIILGFMGGCLWGFASGSGRTPTIAQLAATAIPVLAAFLTLFQSHRFACLWLAFGFVILQVIDLGFQRRGLVPDYWLKLRLPLTLGVIACLLLGALYG